jgi:membrane protein required for colicin V production
MNPMDIGVVAVIVLSAIFAFARGFVREALSIVAWVGAAFITLRGFGAAFALIDPIVKNPLLSQLIAGFGLFVISLVILTIITSIIGRYVRTSSLSAIDRTLGFIFGVARGVLIVCLAYLLLDAALAKEDRPAWVQQAKSTRYLQQGADELKTFLPEQFKLRSAAAGDDFIKNMGSKAASEAVNLMAAPPVRTPKPEQPVQASSPEQPPQPPPLPPSYKPSSQREMNRLMQNHAQPR